MTKTAKIGKTKRVFIKVQLDDVSGVAELKAPASNPALKLRYFRGNNNVTQKITSPSGWLVVLDIGETKRLTLQFTPKPGISDVSLATSGQNGPNLDRVRLDLNAP